MDWQETLERAIPQPPPAQPDPAALVADGKRLVRRRRIAVVAGTAAAVAAVIGIGAIVVPSRDTATPNPPIATRTTEEWPPAADIPLSDLAPVAYDFETGETTLQDGWTETDRVGPFTAGNSLAVAATDGEKTIYAYFESPSEIAFTDASRTTTKDFQTWVDDISLNPLEPEWTNGRLDVGENGWRIVREIPNPLGYATPWDSVGAVVERDGLVRWMLLSGSNTAGGESFGDSGTYAIPGQTIDEWLAEAEEADRRRDFRPGDGGLEGTPTEAVEFGSGSEVVPAADGVEIVDQIADPDIDGAFSDGSSRTAAVRITVRDKERFVLIREKGGTTLAVSYVVLPAPRAEDRAPLTLDQFVAAAARHALAEGMVWR